MIMNKKYIFITSLLSIILIFWMLFFNKIFEKNYIVKDVLIKNISSDNSIKSDTSYVIWNEIELYYILDYSNGNNISIDLSLLEQEFTISSIVIWDEILEISNTIDFVISDNTALKIIWIAKNNNNIWEKNIRELIQISAKKIEKLNNKNNTSEEIINIEKKSWNINVTIDKISDDLDNIQEEIISENNIELEQKWIIDNNIEIIPEIIKNNIFSDLEFNNISFNSNINNLLEISWENINKIKFLNIWSYSFTPTFKDETAYFLIKKNTFSTGNYFVFIQPIEWKIIPLEIQIDFSFTDSKVNIANITPALVDNTKDTYIVLQWNWFLDIISLQLNNNIILKETSFDIINDKVLSVKIDKQLQTWTYHFNIMTTDGIINLDNMNFTITQ